MKRDTCIITSIVSRIPPCWYCCPHQCHTAWRKLFNLSRAQCKVIHLNFSSNEPFRAIPRITMNFEITSFRNAITPYILKVHSFSICIILLKNCDPLRHNVYLEEGRQHKIPPVGLSACKEKMEQLLKQSMSENSNLSTWHWSKSTAKSAESGDKIDLNFSNKSSSSSVVTVRSKNWTLL